MTPKLSIVTSFYNCAPFIDELAQSILSQSYKNWEWIICDDFSTDDTMVRLKALVKDRLSKKDDRIKIIKQAHKKQIWWNPQLYATGDIICPIDGDDKILPKTFDKIIHYFSKFPDVVLMHFNANKYDDVLPITVEDMLDSFYDNVFISRDNVSFLDAFERLWHQRSNIFGYLRIFRNIPGLKFTEYPDGDECSSNDGQWLLVLEEQGKCLAIPRTTYLARQHGNSENFRNWNIRGEVRLMADANMRRTNHPVKIPTISDYFNDVYVAAESTYLSRMNWETKSCKVCFRNYGYSQEQREKLKMLFFDHNLFFDNKAHYSSNGESFEGEVTHDYTFIRIRYDDNISTLAKLLDESTGDITLYCDNVHLHHNNRTGSNTFNDIKDVLNDRYTYFIKEQENRAIITCMYKNDDSTAKPINTPVTDMADLLTEIYTKTELKRKGKRKPDNRAEVTFINGPKVTIVGPKSAKYLVKFINNKTGHIEFSSELTNKNNNRPWCECAIKYLVEWKIEIWEDDKLFDTQYFNPENKTIRIHFGSNALGDNLAWIPMVEEFRKQRNCTVLCSSWRNEVFDKVYPNIKFINSSDVVHGVYACFEIGWFYKDDDPAKVDFYRNKRDFKAIPLQATASDTLGVKYREIMPLLNHVDHEELPPIEGKYVCIAPHASAHAKYWNNPGGWQAVINYLNNIGYKVVLICAEKLGNQHEDNKLGGTLTGVVDMSGGEYPLQHRIRFLRNASLYIGLGSGLTWVAWATEVPIILISGFSEKYTEFQKNTHRLINEDVCHGCFNRHKLNAGDWEWCPDMQWTNRHFECTKFISADEVREAIDDILIAD